MVLVVSGREFGGRDGYGVSHWNHLWPKGSFDASDAL